MLSESYFLGGTISLSMLTDKQHMVTAPIKFSIKFCFFQQMDFWFHTHCGHLPLLAEPEIVQSVSTTYIGQTTVELTIAEPPSSTGFSSFQIAVVTAAGSVVNIHTTKGSSNVVQIHKHYFIPHPSSLIWNIHNKSPYSWSNIVSYCTKYVCPV